MVRRLSSLLTLALAALALPALAADLKIHVAYPTGMNGQIPVVMERTGIAREHGFDAEYTMFQNGPPMMEALASGNVDAVITSLMPITTFLSRQPGRALVVAQLGASSHSLMVGKDSGINTLADLRGRKIAVSFSTDSHLDLLRLLRENRLEPGKDVTLVNTQPNELMLAIAQKFADAILIRVPQVERMQEQFGARVIHSWPFRFAVLMRSDYLKENPGARARFVDALEAAVFYTSKNRLQAAQWFAERLRLDPQTVLRASGSDPIFRAARVEDVDIRVTPGFQKLLEDWTEDSLRYDMVKSRIDVAASIAR